MSFWRRSSLFKDPEIELGQSSQIQSPLQSYEVVITPSPSFHSRVRKSLQPRRWFPSVITAKTKIIVMVAFNVIWAVYVTVDAYATIHPGSKIAANISVNTSTSNTFDSFLWIFAFFAVIVNLFVASVWVDWAWNWGLRVLRMDDIWRETSRFDPVACFGFWIVVIALITTPGWATEVVRISWQKIAWSHVCDGWEVDAVLTGVDFGAYFLDSPNTTLVGSAAITIGQGGYTMQLFQDAILHNFFTFNVSDTLGFEPPLSTIWYDMIATTYTVANVTTSFDMTPNLSFPSLNLQLADPSIPFVHGDLSYPPSANLIYSNGTSDSRLLRTELLKYQHCTQLKVCGMQGSTGTFQIALGVVMIEQFSAAVFCTIPEEYSGPAIPITVL